MKDNLITPPSKTFLARLGQGLKYAFSGEIKSVPFGAGQGLQPVYQDLKGRQMDFQTGINFQAAPRQDEEINFDGLRNLSYNCGVVRAIIESRKDEIARLNWTISTKDGQEDVPKAEAIKEFFLHPDKENTWDSWLRMIMEDIFVIDGACLYPRFTRGGALYSIELIDASMIKKIINNDGRTPIPPLAAYQQVIHGVQSVSYTADEIMYLMRNPRTSKIYGYSPVEQIKAYVDIALRKQQSQLEYYTAGSIPDMITGLPETWGVDQIKSFQSYWDELFSGDTAERRRNRFVPGGMNFIIPKQPMLKDEFDEWLARIACFCFSISPAPFTKSQNRATAEVVQEAAQIRGLIPVMKWVKGFMDLIITKYFGESDIEFVWREDKEADPLIMAQIHDIYLKNGVMDVNEVRDSLGMAKLTPAQINAQIQLESQDKSPTSESSGKLTL